MAAQIEHRPILRPAEVLETVPGMVVTQCSGGGKANQYFLRDFNLYQRGAAKIQYVNELI